MTPTPTPTLPSYDLTLITLKAVHALETSTTLALTYPYSVAALILQLNQPDVSIYHMLRHFPIQFTIMTVDQTTAAMLRDWIRTGSVTLNSDQMVDRDQFETNTDPISHWLCTGEIHARPLAV